MYRPQNHDILSESSTELFNLEGSQRDNTQDTNLSEKQDDKLENTQYLNAWRMVPLTLGLTLAMFVVALDNTIIATAIPKITTEFDSLPDAGWYGSVYLLCTVALQPVFGKIYSFWNAKWTFIGAIACFEVGSVIDALSQSSPVFIIGRAISGCGAAGVYAGVITIVGVAAPLDKRPTYISCVASTFAVAAVVGPLLGGVLTGKVGWRWCFWINPFLGGAATLAVLLFFRLPGAKLESTKPFWQKLREIDFVGSVLLVGGCVALILPLQQGGDKYSWTDARVWGPLGIVFPLILGGFIYSQIRAGENAVLPLRILKQRTVWSSCAFTFFQLAGVNVHLFYLPFYFQAVQGVSTIQSGIRSIPYLIANVLPAIIVAIIITKVGFYTPFMVAGGAISSVGAGLLYTLQTNSNSSQWIGYQVCAGLGLGVSASLPIVAIQAVLDPADYAIGNAVYLFCQKLGGTITIPVAQAILQNTLLQEVPHYAPGITGEEVVVAGATDLRHIFPADVILSIVKAYMLAIQRAFILPIAMAGLTLMSSIFVEWKSVSSPKKRN